jgi:exopolysaccharide biosynthesis polyprenyl glycosylphosphotransferase
VTSADLLRSLPRQRTSVARLRPRAVDWQRVVVRRILLGDLAAAMIAACTALVVRFPHGASDYYLLISLGFPFAWVAACAMTRSYEQRFLGTGTEEYRRVFDAGIRLLAATALALFAFRVGLARTYALIGFPLATALTLVNRAEARRQLRHARAAGDALHRVVVVGLERSAAELIRQLHRDPGAGFHVVGVCLDGRAVTSVEGIPVVGTSSDLVTALTSVAADTVAITSYSGLSQDDMRRLAWQLEGSKIDLVVSPSLTEVAGPRIHIRPVAGLPLLHVEQPEFTGSRRLLKAVFDRTLSAAALLFLLPVLAVIALAVRLDSKGPALFRQIRVGEDGQTFTLLKFRSMCRDAEQRLKDVAALNERSEGLLFKVRQDPRVTRLGRFIRKYSLDELPQLINVLRGDMSLVGPRPPLPTEVSQYGDDVRRRLLVKPGITGLWQVSGRSDLDWDASVSLDLHYVENWSLALDLSILARTFAAVIKPDGAY